MKAVLIQLKLKIQCIHYICELDVLPNLENMYMAKGQTHRCCVRLQIHRVYRTIVVGFKKM